MCERETFKSLFCLPAPGPAVRHAGRAAPPGQAPAEAPPTRGPLHDDAARADAAGDDDDHDDHDDDDAGEHDGGGGAGIAPPVADDDTRARLRQAVPAVDGAAQDHEAAAR